MRRATDVGAGGAGGCLVAVVAGGAAGIPQCPLPARLRGFPQPKAAQPAGALYTGDYKCGGRGRRVIKG